MIKNDMTDEQVYEAALEEWTGILAQLWTGIGKSPDDQRLKIYCDQLKDVSLGLLELAISRVMRENTWNVVPPIGTIWQAIRKELGDPHDLEYSLKIWHPVYRSRLAQESLFA
jgi:hypothetical protein